MEIMCKKLQKIGQNIGFLPFKGILADKIKANISQEAWELWMKHQTILINEYRLNLLDEKSKTFLYAEMEKFFFGENFIDTKQFTA